MATILSNNPTQDSLATKESLFRNLRVMLVVNSVEMGGVEEPLRQIATGRVGRGAHVSAIVPEEAAIDPLARAARAAGMTVERLTLSRSMLRPAGLWRLLRLVRLLRASRPDVLHLHLIGFGGGRWALLGAILARVPAIVCTIHVAPRERQGWKTRLGRALLTPCVDRYIAVSQASKDRLVSFLGMPPASLVVVPNAVELGRFDDAPAESARSAIRRQWEIPPDAPVLGVLARLAPQKGLTYLISAMPAILAEHPDVYALVVGEGYLRPDLEAQARSLGVDGRVMFVGYHQNVVEYLQASDLFVLPSLYEGMPLSILEAMGAGLPVAATAVDGTPEVVLDGETGLLVPPEDPPALARAVNRLLADRALAARMGQAGQARADRFSEGALLDRVGAVYRQALDRHRSVRQHYTV
jgi:glycosyltransferase involved in cell wall biosynthesis